MFDAADSEAAPHRGLENQRRIARMVEALSRASAREVPRVVLRKARGYLGYELERRARGVFDRVSVATLMVCLRGDLALPSWVRRLSVRRIYSFAEARYRPRGKVRREIVLYRATHGDGADEPITRHYEDPLLGWGRRTAEGVRVIEAPGGHSSMLQEPNVAGLAGDLARYLHELDLDLAAAVSRH
jgi:thioesterase domain-containing protein